MKENAPEKIYVHVRYKPCEITFSEVKEEGVSNVEYIRKDAFIEKALKWYCLDCECNDNCKDTKCFFYRQYERYLNGAENCLPPKFSDVILNEDGSTSDNWRHRHFISKMQDVFIEKAVEWIETNVKIILCGDKIDTDKFVKEFKNALKI